MLDVVSHKMLRYLNVIKKERDLRSLIVSFGCYYTEIRHRVGVLGDEEIFWRH